MSREEVLRHKYIAGEALLRVDSWTEHGEPDSFQQPCEYKCLRIDTADWLGWVDGEYEPTELASSVKGGCDLVLRCISGINEGAYLGLWFGG